MKTIPVHCIKHNDKYVPLCHADLTCVGYQLEGNTYQSKDVIVKDFQVTEDGDLIAPVLPTDVYVKERISFEVGDKVILNDVNESNNAITCVNECKVLTVVGVSTELVKHTTFSGAYIKRWHSQFVSTSKDLKDELYYNIFIERHILELSNGDTVASKYVIKLV